MFLTEKETDEVVDENAALRKKIVELRKKLEQRVVIAPESTQGYHEGDLVTINEACAIVRKSRRTIYNWLATGKLQAVRDAGGNVCVVRSSLTTDEPVHVQPGN